METCPVRFDFNTELKGKLKYVHNVPRSLVTPKVAQPEPEYIKNFLDAMQPIMLEHDAECRAASSTKCTNCGSRSVKVLTTPMSWLHIVDEPFVNVLVDPVCDKSMCEMRTRQEIQDMMAQVMKESPGADKGTEESRNMTEILPCKVCGKTEKTMRCARCKVVAYCGKEHQKADWKVHKRACEPFTR